MFVRHLSKFHKMLIMLLLVFHCVLLSVYLTLNNSQDICFSESCLWSEFSSKLSSTYTLMGGLLVYSWTSICLIIVSWLLVARLDIRKFPGQCLKVIITLYKSNVIRPLLQESECWVVGSDVQPPPHPDLQPHCVQ